MWSGVSVKFQILHTACWATTRKLSKFAVETVPKHKINFHLQPDQEILYGVG